MRSLSKSQRLDVRPRILLVVDAWSTGNILGRLLEEDGFAVVVAEDAQTAIAELRHGPLPQAIVTLATVPGDSFAIVTHARARDPGIVIILVTERPQLLDGARGQLGEHAVLTKPVDYAALRNQLEELLGARHESD